jgi:propanol-preferring alcohol dehydrogenase
VAIDVVCGACRDCLAGETQRCRRMQRIGFERDGGHAEYVAVPAANLIATPPGLPDDAAAILPDAVACMYHAIVRQGRVGPGQSVLILGAGGLGIHGVQIARRAGAAVIATSRRPERLRAAQEAGALPVDPTSASLPDAVREATGGEGLDAVVDTIGTRDSVREGLSLLRPGGKLLVLAYAEDAFQVPSIPLFKSEQQIIGCRGASRRDLVEVVRLAGTGAIRPVVGAHYPLAEIGCAVDRLQRGDVVGRIVLTR